jgi:hypothetical protein
VVHHALEAAKTRTADGREKIRVRSRPAYLIQHLGQRVDRESLLNKEGKFKPPSCSRVRHRMASNYATMIGEGGEVYCEYVNDDMF